MDPLAEPTVKSADEQIPEVYARTSGPLRSRLLRSAGGDGDLADDILQDTWLRAVQNWRKSGVPDRPAAWLAVVARNLLRNSLRQRRHAGESNAESLDTLADNSQTADVVGLLEASDRATELRHAMSRLARADSEILTRFYVDRTPAADLAVSLGISSRAVEGRLRRARSKLRAKLETLQSSESGTNRFPMLDPTGFGSGVSVFARKFVTTALLPFVAVLAFAPAAFVVNRLPRRRLAWLRIAGGALLFLVATIAADDAARIAYIYLMQAGAFGMVLWGIAMLRTPDRRVLVHPTCADQIPPNV